MTKLFYRFTESGIIQHWFRNIDYPKGPAFMLQFFDNKIERSMEQRPLMLDNVSSGFYLLLIGLFISIVVFVIEICY